MWCYATYINLYMHIHVLQNITRNIVLPIEKKINLNYNQPSSISRICENKHKKIIK